MKKSALTRIQNINPYENLKEILGVDMGSAIYDLVKESKALELENARLRRVILEAVSQRFPKRAGIQFLHEKGIIVQ